MEIKTHPIYDMYEFNANGFFRLKGKNTWLQGSLSSNGKYLCCGLKKAGENKRMTLAVHRAMWETFKEEIQEGYEIDHIDNNPKNNHLNNLQCITIQENRKRRDHAFLKDIGKNAHQKKQNIKCIDIATGDENIFKSKSQAGKYYGCSPAMVYLICENKNKTKLFGGNIKFEYTDNDVTNVVERQKTCKKNAKKE